MQYIIVIKYVFINFFKKVTIIKVHINLGGKIMASIWNVNSTYNIASKRITTKLAFQLGERFLARVVGKSDSTGELLLKLLDGWQFSAELEEPLDFIKDELLQFEVDGFENGKLKLKLVKVDEKANEENQEGSIEGFVKDINLSLKKEDYKLLEQMIKFNMPLTKENIQKVKTITDFRDEIKEQPEKVEQFIENYLKSKNIEVKSPQAQEIKKMLTEFFNELKALTNEEILTFLENDIELTSENVTSFKKIVNEPLSLYKEIKDLDNKFKNTKDFIPKVIKVEVEEPKEAKIEENFLNTFKDVSKIYQKSPNVYARDSKVNLFKHPVYSYYNLGEAIKENTNGNTFSSKIGVLPILNEASKLGEDLYRALTIIKGKAITVDRFPELVDNLEEIAKDIGSAKELIFKGEKDTVIENKVKDIFYRSNRIEDLLNYMEDGELREKDIPGLRNLLKSYTSICRGIGESIINENEGRAMDLKPIIREYNKLGNELLNIISKEEDFNLTDSSSWELKGIIREYKNEAKNENTKEGINDKVNVDENTKEGINDKINVDENTKENIKDKVNVDENVNKNTKESAKANIKDKVNINENVKDKVNKNEDLKDLSKEKNNTITLKEGEVKEVKLKNNDGFKLIEKTSVLIKEQISNKTEEIKNIIKDILRENKDIKPEVYKQIIGVINEKINDFKVYNTISNGYYYLDLPLDIKNSYYKCKLIIKDERNKGKKIDSKNVKIVASVEGKNLGVVDAYIKVFNINVDVELKCEEKWMKVLDIGKKKLEKAIINLGYNANIKVDKKEGDITIVTCRDFFDDKGLSSINVRV